MYKLPLFLRCSVNDEKYIVLQIGCQGSFIFVMILNSMQIYDIHIIITSMGKAIRAIMQVAHACCRMFCYVYVPTIPTLSIRYIILYDNVHRLKAC